MKQEVDSRDEARHTEKSDQWFSLFREEAEDGRASVTTGASIIVSLKRDENLQVGWLTGGDNSVSNRFNNIVCVARFLVGEDHKTF